MIAQEVLFDSKPPEPPRAVQVADPLGSCVKCNKPATLKSPGGNVYCAEHGRCGGKTIKDTALGVSVEICGKSVEQFVFHLRMRIYCCPCVVGG